MTAPRPDSKQKTVARIQVAGVHDIDEARLIAACGVGWIGIPLRLAVNREDVTDSAAAEIAAACASWSVTCVLITYLYQAVAIRDLAHDLGVAHVQIHGRVETGELRRLRAADPELFVIKSLVVHGGNEAELRCDVQRCSPYVDAFITDTFDPETGASGATGLVHDWDVSRRLVLASPKPVILAGGLNPGNVAAGIAHVGPAGVDVHTGIEGADGRKTRERVQAFVDAVREGYARTARPQRSSCQYQ